MSQAKQRVDGPAKVTGGKIYASDLKPKDLNWPADFLHALLLRIPSAQHPLKGLQLEPEDRPYLLVDGQKLRTDKITAVKASVLPLVLVAADSMVGETPSYQTPAFAGHPVAILGFPTARKMRQFRSKASASITQLPDVRFPIGVDVRQIPDPLLRAAEIDRTDYTSVHLIKGKMSDGQDFSFQIQGGHNPSELKDPAITQNKQARQVADANQIRVLSSPYQVLDRSFFTQITDPMFMEPEAGLGWFDEATTTLHLALGTQSPEADRAAVVELLKNSPFNQATVKIIGCFPGGGFGGRDASNFVLYLALAALYAPTPVRLAYTREEQFQTGIKRHATATRNLLAYDSQGKLQDLRSTSFLDGGGENNLTGAVTGLNALHAGGPYFLETCAISAYGVKTTNAPAGSMRGFGIPQATFAIESMVDEVAQLLKAKDAIEFRKQSLLKQGDQDLAGVRLDNHLANLDLLNLAQVHPLWTDREKLKKSKDSGPLRFGVGFACCSEAYGATSDNVWASLELSEDGELHLRTPAVDMGQGTATALAQAVFSKLGIYPNVVMGESDYFQSNSGFSETETKDPAKYPPLEGAKTVPKFASSMSASMTAFHHVHVVEEVAQLFYDSAIVPTLRANGLEPPKEPGAWNDLVAMMVKQSDGVRGVMGHAFFWGTYASADWTVDGQTTRRALDALGLLRSGTYQMLARQKLDYPPFATMSKTRRTLYASSGHLVVVQVNVVSGEVKIVSAVSFVDAGEVHHEKLLLGQVEGGLAMGIGMALLENLDPQNMTRPVNLNLYEVPRLQHMPKQMETKLVPLGADSVIAGSFKRRKKGVAEACMTTVPAAIANAVAHAIGRRIRQLPITPERVLEALADG